MGFTELKLVEDDLVQKLEEKGWRFIPLDELGRDSYEEPLLIPNLIRALKRINSNTGLGEEEVNRVLNELKLTVTGTEGAKRILNFYKFGVPVKFEKERVVKFVHLFDYESPDNNEFIVTRQVYYYGRDKIRTDIMLYINGIPLVDIECKNPVSISESWVTAFQQIKDYENIVPELYKYVQVGIAAESQARYFPIVPWQKEGEVKTHMWQEEGKDSIDSTIEMLSKGTLLDILRNFLFFRIERGEATKVITRYMQYRAAKKIVNRVIKNLKGEDDKNKGLVWHWQGSGKTLTMIFASNELYYMKELGNPTIFFIVDRIELEDQLYKEFYFLDIVRPEIIGSVGELKEVLGYDDYRGKRGAFITLIHKFRPEELDKLQEEIEDVSKHKETIMNRKTVVTFVDEGHRTQYGLLAAQMKAMLKNAFFFALTGTPISKRGKDTYLEFSYPPKELYLDRYFVTDSIRDGFTVKIVYQQRLEKDRYLKKDLLDAYLKSELEDLSDEMREHLEERIKSKLNEIDAFLEDPGRIKVIAEDIANHFKENIDGKFKAMVVAGSRTACAIYKEELDKHLPKQYSEVVMTYYDRESDKRKTITLREARGRYGELEPEDLRKKIRESFIEEEFPKILIVTEMLLAGFDAPILQVMYLDKPLKEHRLLQAIARTNRPFKDLKEAGLVIDYVGILKEFTKAFENYTKEDITGVLLDLNQLTQDFTQTINETMALFTDIPKDQYDRQTMLKAFETITANEQNTKKFRENYRHVRKLFELLGPHEVKLQKLQEYTWLTQVYTFYLRMTRQDQYEEYRYVPKYFTKTLKYVYKTTELADIEKQYPTIQFDTDYLKNLQEKIKTKEEKAANILFTLNRFIIIDKQRNPIYETLTEKVERILKLWKEKTKDFEKIYNEGTQIIKEINKLQSRQKQLAFTDLQYSILLNMEQKLGTDKNLTQDTHELTGQLQPQMFKGWQYQQTTRKTIEREVRKYLRKYIKQHQLNLTQLEELYQKIIESVKTY